MRARQADAGTIEVAIADAGPGVPAAKLARLFEPFFTTKPDGMGLGLPISSTIIGAHGGRIWAESSPAGATFFFTVPVSDEDDELLAPQPTVFVVDDDASFRASVSRLLRAAGHQVKAFSSASEFVQSLPATGPGCVVADLQMPGLSGLDLQAALAGSENPLPVLFLTGHGDIPTSVQAMRLGAEDFLTKRAPREALLDAVGRALARDARERAERARVEGARARFATLTGREREVLEHVLRGQLNKQIAGGPRHPRTDRQAPPHRHHEQGGRAVGRRADAVVAGGLP